MNTTRTALAITCLALLGLLVTACGGSPIVARSPEALYSLAKEQLANARFTPAVDTLARAVRAEPEGELAGPAHVLRMAALSAMARGTREVAESYLAGHEQAGDAEHAPQMRAVAIDYFGRARGRAIEVVEALDLMVQQPPAVTLRVDFSAAAEPKGDPGKLSEARQGRMLDYDELIRVEEAVMVREFRLVLNELNAARGSSPGDEIQPAAFYLSTARGVVSLAEIFRQDALNDSRMRRLFYERAATAAGRAAELARERGNQPLAEEAEQLLAECRDVLGKK